MRLVSQLSNEPAKNSPEPVMEAINHHINTVPLLYQAQQEFPEEVHQAGRILATRSPVLAEISPFSSSDIDHLIEFLHSITSKTVLTDKDALHADVPSENNQFIQN